MPVADAPDDDDVRQTYNFAPGSHGLVYRADVPDYGAGGRLNDRESEANETQDTDSNKTHTQTQHGQSDAPGETRYKLQTMKWGLVPFWTKRSPDYGSVMRTINARDDSLAGKGGMWNTMKQRKRCIVVAQGFYEWLKKDGGKTKIPHYTKRKDEQLMCFAGLWDCVQYEGSEEKHYTYTIITTDSNKQLSFLHDRMPVILDNGSEAIRTWLDPGRSEWSKELQMLLKPYQGELECYPVSKEVGKVGNNSPSFIIPVASSQNKHNIANFFGHAEKSAKGDETKSEVKSEADAVMEEGLRISNDKDEKRVTVEHDGQEDNAPVPVPAVEATNTGVKRALEEDSNEPVPAKANKVEHHQSPSKAAEKTPGRRTRSAVNNGTAKESPVKAESSQKITSFFK